MTAFYDPKFVDDLKEFLASHSMAKAAAAGAR
jgi:hypothetical protein